MGKLGGGGAAGNGDALAGGVEVADELGGAGEGGQLAQVAEEEAVLGVDDHLGQGLLVLGGNERAHPLLRMLPEKGAQLAHCG